RLFSLVEIFFGELPRPREAEGGRLHRAFAALLSKFCRISCHSFLLLLVGPLLCPSLFAGFPAPCSFVSFAKSDLRHTFCMQRLPRRLVPATLKKAVDESLRCPRTGGCAAGSRP